MGRPLVYGNPPIEVTLRRSNRARRISLRVSRLDGRVTLTLPPRTPDRAGLDFVAEREAWLRGHLADLRPTAVIQDGGSVMYQGCDLRVEAGPVRRTLLQDGVLIVPNTVAVAPRVKVFLQTRARDALVAASDHYAGLLGSSYQKISLRDTRSRWGSCTSQGALMYSWRLIMAPPDVLSYVAAHEVAHLVEMNHAPAFWAVVATLMPDYQTHRDWLRREGDSLHRVSFEDDRIGEI